MSRVFTDTLPAETVLVPCKQFQFVMATVSSVESPWNRIFDPETTSEASTETLDFDFDCLIIGRNRALITM